MFLSHIDASISLSLSSFLKSIYTYPWVRIKRKLQGGRRVIWLNIRYTFSCFGPSVSFFFVHLIPLFHKSFHILCAIRFKPHFLLVSSGLVNSTRTMWFGCMLYCSVVLSSHSLHLHCLPQQPSLQAKMDSSS